MEKKIIRKEMCKKAEVEKCDHPMSNNKWGDKYVCEEIRPLDCPHLLCDGSPCVLGGSVDTNKTEVEFPCDKCKKYDK